MIRDFLVNVLLDVDSVFGGLSFSVWKHYNSV
jgi:hypothetical protein